MESLKLNLQWFAANLTTDTTATTGNDVQVSIKTWWNPRLLDYAVPNMVYNQFGDTYDIPKHGGKTIEFRSMDPFPKALTALVEGTPPAGRKINMSAITATIAQYGDYAAISDILDWTAKDKINEEIIKRFGTQAGLTLDTLTREVLMSGTNKMLAPSVTSETETEVFTRADITSKCVFSPKVVNRAVNKLKRVNAKKIDDSFVAVIHPDLSCDLQNNPNWIDLYKYAQPTNIYNGEIGKLGGCRFVETSEAKIIGPANIFTEAVSGVDVCRLSVKTATPIATGKNIPVTQAITAAQATELNAVIAALTTAGKTYKLYIGGVECVISSVTAGDAGSAYFTLADNYSGSAADGAMICGTGAGKDGSAVYCPIFLAANAYGRTKLENGGLEFVVKELGSAGSADPLNQQRTAGWKATHVAEILSELYIVRVECGSPTYSADAVSN